jgi:predicted AlkP superfamily phosphohydrolase/phosphomutase
MSGSIVGYWLSENQLFEDNHEKYEISIDNEYSLFDLIDFIGEMCKKIEEKCIYVTIGDESYLVHPSN